MTNDETGRLRRKPEIRMTNDVSNAKSEARNSKPRAPWLQFRSFEFEFVLNIVSNFVIRASNFSPGAPGLVAFHQRAVVAVDQDRRRFVIEPGLLPGLR